ncbi:MAG: hypothetical protein CMJ48_08625, partial [Planctomycetaceae bacterium]|nr:hypothetical protein [Planctomycetaceae bacterium]
MEFDGKATIEPLPTLLYDGSHPLTMEARISFDGEFPKDLKHSIHFLGRDNIVALQIQRKGVLLAYAMSVPEPAHALANQILEQNQAAHVAVVYDGKTLSFYVDGKLQRERVPAVIAKRDIARSLGIGAYQYSDEQHSNTFRLIMDEVRFSNTARYTKDFTPQKRFETDKSTLALYHFDSGSGTVLKDSSGNGHHGKMVGAKWVSVDDELNVIEKPRTPLAAAADHHRRAAEWVISVGGSVGCFEEERYLNVSKVEDLPSKPFVLVDMELNHVEQPIDEGLKLLRGLSTLTDFGAFHSSLTDTGLANLTDNGRVRFPNLTHVHLVGTQVSDIGWRYLSESPGLERVELRATNISDGRWMVGCLQLQHVDISVTRIPPEHLADLVSLPDLRRLNISGSQLKGVGAKHVGNCRQLKEFAVYGCREGFDSSVLQRMVNLTHLTLEDVDRAQLNASLLSMLARMPKLEYMSIADADFDGGSIQGAEPLKSVRMFAIKASLEDDFVVAHQRLLPNLDELTLGYCELTDADLKHFEAWTGLRRLFVADNPKLTEPAVAALHKALPNCTIVSDFGTLEGAQASAPPRAVAPFDAEQAKQHQAAWAKHLGVPVEKNVDLGGGEKLTMVLIPPGEFLMGSTDEERARFLKEATAAGNQSALDATNAEGPQHRVAITKPFYLSACEVTQEQYRLVAGTSPSYFSSSGDGKETVAGQVTHRHPVENVSWLDAVSFCNKLSAQEERQPSYAIAESNVTRANGNGYRLPTEAEWEYACRAGSTGAFHFADEGALDNHAWIAGNSRDATHPVGAKQPNGFGVYDMYGNVLEWCWDWYAVEHYKTRAGRGGVNDPLGPAAGLARVLRGGYINQNVDCRSASRGGQPPDTRISDAGFRLALTIDAVKALTRIENVPPPAAAPFDAEQAKQHQAAWAKHLDVPVEKTVDLGDNEKLTMVLIPPGEFLMGSTDEDRARLVEAAPGANGGSSIDRDPNEGPQHRVKITQPFWLSRHEVTRGQLQQFVEQAGHKTEAERNGKGGFGVVGGQWGQDPRFVWSNPGFEQTDEHPVVQVSRNDAEEFCRWLSKKAGGAKYVLPSEAQWEYACRAGSTTLFYLGDSEAALGEQVWSKENSPRGTHPVGQLKPNAWNLFDMHGNVWEWCSDGYAADYYKKSPTNDPTGPATSPAYVSRGGGWGSHAWESRSTGRSNKTAEYADHAQGFRVAMRIDAPLPSGRVGEEPRLLSPHPTVRADFPHTAVHQPLA